MSGNARSCPQVGRLGTAGGFSARPRCATVWRVTATTRRSTRLALLVIVLICAVTVVGSFILGGSLYGFVQLVAWPIGALLGWLLARLLIRRSQRSH
jgi:hypothetical protein